MNDFLYQNPAFSACFSATENKRFRRPDTFQAAADVAGVSVPHVYRVLHGTRDTTERKRRDLLAWARGEQQAGRGDSPAVRAALENLS